MIISSDISKTHPGPQIKLRKFNAVFSFLLACTIIFFLLTIYAILKQNFNLLRLPELEHAIEILDTKTACTLFATFLGLLLVRHQFIVGLQPRFVYECAKVKSASNPEFDDKGIVWRVKIQNVGLGAAAFVSCKFRIGINSINSGQFFDYKMTIENLRKNGFSLEKDFYLLNITFGSAMSAKDFKIIFEILIPAAQKIKQLDMRIVFTGYLGGKYQKDLYLIPRLGIPSKTLERNAAEFDDVQVE
jgi:hypothetical protein